MEGNDIPRLYVSADEPDGDFDGAVGDDAVVAEAWEAWRREVAHAEAFVDRTESLDTVSTHPTRDPITLRELLVHLIEEYARHCGHADLLRERIDGRTGEGRGDRCVARAGRHVEHPVSRPHPARLHEDRPERRDHLVATAA